MRKLGLAAVAASAFSVAGCSGSSTAPMESAGLVISGPADDGGWNASAVKGLNELHAAGIATRMTANVDDDDQIAALESYASAGYTYVIAHGGEFTAALQNVSVRYPNVRFLQTNGWTSSPNWRSLTFRGEEIGYVMGFMSGLATPTGKVGLIIQKDEDQAIIDAALHGLQDANPIATLQVVKTDDFDTPSQGEAAAETLLADDVDTMAVFVDGAYPGVHTAVSGHPGVKTFRLRAAQSLPAGEPEVMGGVMLHTGGLFKKGIDAFETGQPASILNLGFKEDALELSDFAAGFPESLRQQVRAAIQGIVNGTITP